MTPDEPTKKRKHGQVGEKAADEGHKVSSSPRQAPITYKKPNANYVFRRSKSISIRHTRKTSTSSLVL